MYVIQADGRVLRAMDAVRAVYAAVGLGWLVAPTGWPGIRWLADGCYRFLARHRMTISRILRPQVRLWKLCPSHKTLKTVQRAV